MVQSILSPCLVLILFSIALTLNSSSICFVHEISQDGRQMVEVKFNSCIIIPHYCNKRFALHMHTSIIYALIFSTFNTTIHKNTNFMVISYNFAFQNTL
jgi:hypothetical protein